MITLRLDRDTAAKPCRQKAEGWLNARIAQIPPDAHKEFDLGEARMHAQDTPAVLSTSKRRLLFTRPTGSLPITSVAHMEMGKAVDAEPELQSSGT